MQAFVARLTGIKIECIHKSWTASQNTLKSGTLILWESGITA